jgi:hypothetical protein
VRVRENLLAPVLINSDVDDNSREERDLVPDDSRLEISQIPLKGLLHDVLSINL